jgi:hypothetical protein
MNACLSMVLAVSVLLSPLALADGPAANESADVVGMVCGDWVDLALILEDPTVDTRIVGAWEHGDVAVLTVVHSTEGDASECVWVGLYTFPSSIFAHSIVSVPFHAEEME